MSESVVFLDFDGVLNYIAMVPHAYPCARGPTPCGASGIASTFGKERIQQHNMLTVLSKADIVLSTSWRKSFAYPELAHALADAGLVGNVIGETIGNARAFWRGLGHEADRMQRGHEIAAWLLTHPETKRAVILDDDGDMWTLQPLLVQARAQHGLTSDDVRRALDTLAGSAATIAQLHAQWTIRAAESPSTQGYTPFEGIELSARVEATFLRGIKICEDGRVIGKPRGRYLHRPTA